jgi:hypothetical protein
MKADIFWDIAQRSPYLNRPFRGTYYLHLQGRKSAEEEIILQHMARKISAKLIFDPEERGVRYHRKISSNADYTAL